MTEDPIIKPAWGATTAGNEPVRPEILFYSQQGLGYTPKAALFEKRIITFNGQINEHSAQDCIEKLLALDARETQDSKDITMYINSPGGSVIDGLAIYDTMQHLKSDICTVVIGLAASMGSILAAAGAPNKRYALPHARIMLHELSGIQQGRYHQMKINSDLAENLLNELLDIYLNHIRRDKDGNFIQFGGQTNMDKFSEIRPELMTDKQLKPWLKKWLEKDRWLDARQALTLGLVDQVIESKTAQPKTK
jgi:ATP-dependent Clp protease protease subunit